MSKPAALATTPTTIDPYLKGAIETRYAATKTPRILITWLHANEQLAPRTAHHIYTKRPDLAAHVDYICGNPLAAAHHEDIGFIETDLNRSFDVAQPQSYEEERAAYILKTANEYDYVLDLHGAIDPNFGNCIILGNEQVYKPAIRNIIAASPNTRILVMPQRPEGKALVEIAGNAACFEYSFRTMLSEGLPDVLRTIESLVGIHQPQPIARDIYHVAGTIPKNEDPGETAQNFVFWEKGGYYPILLGTGPRSYREDPTKNYCCFYAKRLEKVIL